MQAFFAAVESDGLRVGVEDQLRMRVLFATHNPWDLTTVRVALRSLLVHDPHQRAPFDRHFQQFFAAEDGQQTITGDQLLGVLEDLRNLPPDDLVSDRRLIGGLIGGLVCLAGGGGFMIWLSRWRQLDLKPLPAPRLDAPGQGFSIAAIGGARQVVVRQKRTRRLAPCRSQP